MRALVQRVDWAEVLIGGQIVCRIDHGLLVYVGSAEKDTESDAASLAEKVLGLRVFEDDDGRLKLSCQDIRGEILAIPDLMVNATELWSPEEAGRKAAESQHVEDLYVAFCIAVGQSIRMERGPFRAAMTIRSAAAGPVNVLIDMPTGTPQH